MTQIQDGQDNEYINELQASVKVGMTTTLLRWFTRYCPKHGQTRKLPFQKKEQIYFYREDDLDDYMRWLRGPWPIPQGGQRANLPDAIRDEIMIQAGHMCAFCTHMNDLEAAHIEPWETSNRNDPDNLIAACPNHHSRYDHGARVNAAINKRTVTQVKAGLIQGIRFRSYAMLEPTKEGLRLAKRISDINTLMEEAEPELKARLEQLVSTVLDQSAEPPAVQPDDMGLQEPNKKVAVAIKNAKEGIRTNKDTKHIQAAIKEIKAVTDEYDDLLDSLDLDVYPCPHCGGKGQIGWGNHLCDYCEGNGTATKQEVDDYDPDNIDFVECPHCQGRGTIGFNGEICEVCDGKTGVTQEEADEYDPEELKTVPCPRCDGRGVTGLNLDPCGYCNGDKWISRSMAADYDPDDVDEVDCPLCNGRGMRQNGDYCKLCNGHCVVTNEINDAFIKKYGSRW